MTSIKRQSADGALTVGSIMLIRQSATDESIDEGFVYMLLGFGSNEITDTHAIAADLYHIDFVLASTRIVGFDTILYGGIT